MAISRAQLLKELLPGLNCLGWSTLVTAKSTRKSTKQRLPSVRSKKKQNCLASQPPLLKTRATQLLMTMRRKHGLLDTTTKPLLWVSR